MPYPPFNKTITRNRISRSSDGQGGWTEGTPTSTSLSCRLLAPSGTEREIAGPNIGEISAVAYVSPTADVERDDEIVDGSITYRITAILTPSIPVYQKLLLEDLQAGN